MKMPSNLMQLRVLAFSLVLIIVPFFVGYYIWINNQTTYLNGRNLRILGTLSTHIQESVSSQSSVLENAMKKYVQDMADKNLYENPEPGVNGQNKEAELVTIEQIKKKEHSSNFQANALDPFKTDGGATLQATSVTVVPKPSDQSLLSAPRITVKEESSQRWLYFDYTVAYPAATPGPPEYLNVKARLNLEQLIGPFVNKREMQENQGSLYQDGFDAVLIAQLDDQMTILFQESPAKLRLFSLNNLTNNNGAKIDVKLFGLTNTADVNAGPADYKLFAQPIQLPVKAADDESESLRWVACGLVEGVHFQQQRLAVSYNVLIAFGFITVLVAVSWSFLKLLFMGPKDRFRRVDACMLAFAAFMIAALLTMGALFYYFYNATLTAGEGYLEQFADSIQRNFYSELDSALTQLDALNNKLDKKTIDAARELNGPQLEKITFRSSILRDGLVTPDSPYPYLLSAFWANERGKQQIKWTVRSSVTNRVNVADRPFVQKLKQERHYNYQTRDKKNHEFWMEPLVSPTTGTRGVVISEFTKAIDPKAKWVSVIELKLFSLMQAVVPEGYGFAVIEDSGKVLFHSAPKLHLGENLFEECDNDQNLRAAVLGRSRKAVTASYFGKGHTLYVAPLENFPWTVVVFNEKDSLRTTFSEILSLCLILFFSYVALLCVLLLASYLIKRYVINLNSPVGSTWIWPDKSKRLLYLESILVNSILLLFSCFAVYVMPGLWQLWLPAVIVVMAVTFLVWRFKRATSSDKPESTSWFNYRKAYIVNVTLLFCLTSIVPTYACFKIAYVEEMKLFIVRGQLSLADAMVAREDRIRGQVRFIYRGTPTDQVSRVIENRIAERRDTYDSFFFQTSQSEVPATENYVSAQPSLLLTFFRRLVPLFDHSSIARHALIAKAADGSWHWDDSPDGTLVLHAREPERSKTSKAENDDPKRTERRVQSSLPTLGSALWWAMLPHVLVAVWLLLLYIIWQMFLLRIEEPASDQLHDSCRDADSPSRLLVLGPHFVGKDQLLTRMGLDSAARFDIKTVSRLTRWNDVLKAKDGPIVLDNFDYGMDDTFHTKHKLDLLEALRREKRTTIALSTVETNRFLSVNGKNGNTNGQSNGNGNGHTNDEAKAETNGAKTGANGVIASPAFADRWPDALSSFLKEEPNDLGNARSFCSDLADIKDRLLERGDLNRQAVESMFALIENECLPRTYLQNVGKALANQTVNVNVSTTTLLKQILNNARPYYAAIWDDCSGEEKLTLTRLARCGLLSPKDPDTEGLLMKGLIVRDPAIRIMNESFRLFILSMHADDDLAKCEKQAKGRSNWEVLKAPFTIGLISVAAFLLLTQRDLYNSAVPLIGSLAAALPSALKLLSLLRPGAKAES
jgi:hypothetical protein